MKKIFLLLVVAGLIAPMALRAQDAAAEERLNKLAGQIEDLQAASVQAQKRIADLTKEIEELRQTQGKANPTYAAQDDLNKLATKLQEVEQKRTDDNEKILKEIEKLGKVGGSRPRTVVTDNPTVTGNDKGYEYVIQNGDTLSTIVAAYREKNIKVTVDSIVKANPGLKPTNLKVGQKIFIPAPAQ